MCKDCGGCGIVIRRESVRSGGFGVGMIQVVEMGEGYEIRLDESPCATLQTRLVDRPSGKQPFVGYGRVEAKRYPRTELDIPGLSRESTGLAFFLVCWFRAESRASQTTAFHHHHRLTTRQLSIGIGALFSSSPAGNQGEGNKDNSNDRMTLPPDRDLRCLQDEFFFFSSSLSLSTSTSTSQQDSNDVGSCGGAGFAVNCTTSSSASGPRLAASEVQPLSTTPFRASTAHASWRN
ncbi:hypothetical protein EX30DRAFT_364968 [Ascodesmis nigricans]|uniref:Uncharacterized protein n=1 Tax=Ascodesmis nigricans TaxID=341454 RepID=A0A4V3SIF4_9PEZI|nr:hypothetical protein EX30DRAFT_364968 [Ascodesmis nigricans]